MNGVVVNVLAVIGGLSVGASLGGVALALACRWRDRRYAPRTVIVGPVGQALHAAAPGEPLTVRVGPIPPSDEVVAERERRLRRGQTPDDWRAW